MFTSADYEKFRELRVTHLATRFAELISDDANDDLTPEQLFLTATDDALALRRENRVTAQQGDLGPGPTSRRGVFGEPAHLGVQQSAIALFHRATD